MRQFETGSDGTIKAVFAAGGGHVFEAALFRVPGRERPVIACVSTQVGCAVRCGFCSTRETGFIRQLTAGEMLEQIETLLDLAARDRIDAAQFEVSFMGMGEPLANSRAVLEAIALTHDRFPRMTRVSVSTAGPAERIRRFAPLAARSPIPIHLQVSLHATTDSVRRRLVPGVRDSVAALLDAAERYGEATGDVVCLNYILLNGINDSPGDAVRLRRLNRQRFYVKLTHLNDTGNLAPSIAASSSERFEAFARTLHAGRMPFKVFKGDGLDVRASCGQLAARPIQILRSDQLPRIA